MLIGDRFFVAEGRVVDLATGDNVCLEHVRLPLEGALAAWTDRCAALVERGRLIDFGVLGDGRAFEVKRRGRPGLEPAATVPDTAVHQVTDLLDAATLGHPRLVRLPPMEPEVRAATLRVIFRHARQRGFVPLALDLLLVASGVPARVAREVGTILRTRHVLIVEGAGRRAEPEDAGTGPAPRPRCAAAIARLVVAIGATTPRPNILLVGPVAGRSETGRVCRPADATDCRRCEAGRMRSPVVASCPRYERAAETHHLYDERHPVYQHRVVARALDALRRGRAPARAEHALRDASFALARRQDTEGAAWMALNLGVVLLERGRPADAARAFDMARQQFDRGIDARGATRAAVYLGLAWTDEGRLPEAEASFRCARIASAEIGAVEIGQDAALGLARCLYWQGRFDEATLLASSVLDDLGSQAQDEPRSVAHEPAAPDGWSVVTGGIARTIGVVVAGEPHREVRAAVLSSRLALVAGDLPTASSRAALALEAARRTGDPFDGCAARTAAAAVACALRDAETLLLHVGEGLAAARRAGTPLRSLRLRLLACDGLRRAGRDAHAARFDRRLHRLDPSRFPALLRARLQIVLSNTLPPRSAVSSLPDAEGHLAIAACPWRLPPARATILDDMVGVLQLCHDPESEEEMLGRVCETLAQRLSTLLVVVAAAGRPIPPCLARRGIGAVRAGFAERAIETGIAIAPMPAPGGVEAAVPIRYAGTVVGVIACRWPSDAPPDPARANGVLFAAAAAIAPHVRSLLDRMATPASGGNGGIEIVGVSEATTALRRAIDRAAAAPFPVLIEGESGVGKELVAQAIHRGGPRRVRRFSAINCAALADDLLEAELFGHVRGAFTGAVAERAGLFEESDGGTLFLDEVAELSPRGQAKLLRAVQEGEVRRLGENLARRVDVRLVAATNRRLEDEVARGTFRRDLFYRLNVLRVDVRPLRERSEDITVLAAHFWRDALTRTGGRATLAPATLAALARYDWPGNVRELQNVLSALAVTAPRRGSVGPGCLPAAIASTEIRGETLEQARRLFERRFVRATLARTGGHRGRAAAALGLSRQGLAKLLARLQLGEEPVDGTSQG